MTKYPLFFAMPIFHVINMMEEDLKLKRWNIAKQEWGHILYFCYNQNRIWIQAFNRKEAQLSVFDDGIKAFYNIKLWREFSDEELERNINRIKSGTHANIAISREILSRTATRWENYGWVRYEENRAQKFRKVQKYAKLGLLPASLFLGINLGE